MVEADVLALLREALSVATLMAAPVLIAALLTGLGIGLLQALTSIQEMTLTFVPKLAVIVLVFWATASATGRLVVDLYENSVLPLIAG
jgi:flagellar biosynthetic protein FliQ